MSGGKTSITLAFLSVAIICIIAGSVLAFSRLLDRFIKPVMDEFKSDIEDDILDFKERRMTNTIWMVVIIGVALLIFSFFVFRFHKVEAMWGPVPVFIPTFFGMLALAWFIPRTRWFNNSNNYTPMWIFLIPTFGLILTIWLGLAKTENISLLRAPQPGLVSYNTSQYTGIFLHNAGDVGGSVLEFGVPDCD
jgi:MFS family permease